MRLLGKTKAPTTRAAERVLTPTTTGPAQKLLLLRVPDEFLPAAFLLGFSAGHGVCSAVGGRGRGRASAARALEFSRRLLGVPAARLCLQKRDAPLPLRLSECEARRGAAKAEREEGEGVDVAMYMSSFHN